MWQWNRNSLPLWSTPQEQDLLPLRTSDLLGDGYRKIIAKLPRNLLGPGVNKCPSNTKSRIAGNEVQSPPWICVWNGALTVLRILTNSEHHRWHWKYQTFKAEQKLIYIYINNDDLCRTCSPIVTTMCACEGRCKRRVLWCPPPEWNLDA